MADLYKLLEEARRRKNQPLHPELSETDLPEDFNASRESLENKDIPSTPAITTLGPLNNKDKTPVGDVQGVDQDSADREEIKQLQDTSRLDLADAFTRLGGGLASAAAGFGGFKADITPTTLAMDYLSKRRQDREARRQELLKGIEQRVQRRRQDLLDIPALEKIKTADEKDIQEYIQLGKSRGLSEEQLRSSISPGMKKFQIREKIDELSKAQKPEKEKWEVITTPVKDKTTGKAVILEKNTITGATRVLGEKPEEVKAGLYTPASKERQEEYNRKAEKYGKPPAPVDATEADLRSFHATLNEEIKQGLLPSFREEKPIYIKDLPLESQRNAIRKIRDSEDKPVMAKLATEGELEKIDGFLSNDPSATGMEAARRAVAQMFNKGALSERDVSAFSGGQTLWQRLGRFVNKNLISGTWGTDADVKEVKDLVNTLKEVSAKQHAAERSYFRNKIESEVGPEIADKLARGIYRDYSSQLPVLPDTENAPFPGLDKEEPKGQKSVGQAKPVTSFVVGKEYQYGDKKLKYLGVNKENPAAAENWEEVVGGPK